MLKSLNEVFKDYEQRRIGIINALTTEYPAFFDSCDPRRDNLCLSANPDGTWHVGPPCIEVPPELPEPSIGINFARDAMNKMQWISMCAIHSDSWLISVAAFYSAQFSQNE